MVSCPFLQQVQTEWQDTVRPMVDDVCGSITQMIQNRTNNPNLFQKCKPVDLYTQIYQMTTHHRFDFCHLDFLYQQEIQTLETFCRQFQAHSLSEMNRHIFGFQILMRWFHVFFHHLHRIRHRSYHQTVPLEEDMISTVRNHYLKPQQAVFSQLFCRQWAQIRKNQHTTDQTLLDSMELLASFHPQYFHDRLLFLYFRQLRRHCQKQSHAWYSQNNILSYMGKVNRFFQQEQDLFRQCFPQYHHERDRVLAILKEIFLHPYGHVFLQDAQYGWKALMYANHLPDIQTAYQYFSWMEEPSPWSSSHQEFLEARIASFPQNDRIIPLAQLLKEQTHLLETVFSHDTLRSRFTTTLGKCVQTAITHHDPTAAQLARTIHLHIHKKSSGRLLQDLSALVAFCPEKELFYGHYHHFLKTRLLMGRHHLPHEEKMLRVFHNKLGASFVLNLRLMLGEIQHNRISDGCCGLYKLSSVIWRLEKETPLQYKPPPPVQETLERLQDQMRNNTSSPVRLEPLWSQGTVVLTRCGTDFYMNPTQAIVLLALEEPTTREKLPGKLQVADDTHHNLDGVLESLSKAMLIVRQDTGEWCWNPWNTTTRVVLVPPIKKKTPTGLPQDPAICPMSMDAFLVRTMKQEKRMKYSQLIHLVSQRFGCHGEVIQPRIRKLVDGEFFSQEGDNTLCYIP